MAQNRLRVVSTASGETRTAETCSQTNAQSANHSAAEAASDLLPLVGALGGGPTGWAARAVCAKSDPDLLFVTGAAQREVAKLCSGCPVKTECLADALDNRIEFGVWGGMTERQRRALLKRAPEVTSWRQLLEDARAETTRTEAS